MLTRQTSPGSGSPATTWPTSRFIRTALLDVLAFSLVACGGSESATTHGPVGTVIVKVMDPAGTPIGGAAVALYAAVNSSDPITDDNGEVVFKDTLAGEREASAAKQGDFAPTRRFVVTPGSVTRLSLIIDRRRQPGGAR
jgi:hypothetical protein